MVKLPEKKSKPVDSLLAYSMLLYGREKIGKTTLASMYEDALFLMCEPGGKSLEIYQIPINNWSEILEVLKLLKENPGKFKTIVIDTVDLAFHYCQDYVCKSLAISHPSEEDYGKGWAAVKDEFSRVMTEIQKIGRGVLFISHAEEKEIRRRSGEVSDRIQPTLSKQGRRVLEPMVDIWAYYCYTPDGKRELIIRGDADIAAGCRITNHFVGISRIPMGTSEKEAYKNLLQAFNTTKVVGKKSSKKIVIKKRR